MDDEELASQEDGDRQTRRNRCPEPEVQTPRKLQAVVNCPHTTLAHFAKGYCRSCYNHVWYEEKKRKAASKQLEAKFVVNDSGTRDTAQRSEVEDAAEDTPFMPAAPAPSTRIPSMPPTEQAPTNCPHSNEVAVCRGLCLDCYLRSNNRWWSQVLGGRESYLLAPPGSRLASLKTVGRLGQKRAEQWVLSVLGPEFVRLYREPLGRLGSSTISDKRLEQSGVTDPMHRKLLLANLPIVVSKINLKCKHCRQHGHTRRACPLAAQTEEPVVPAATAPRSCAQCGKSGHYRKKCPMYGQPDYRAFHAPSATSSSESPSSSSSSSASSSSSSSSTSTSRSLGEH